MSYDRILECGTFGDPTSNSYQVVEQKGFVSLTRCLAPSFVWLDQQYQQDRGCIKCSATSKGTQQYRLWKLSFAHLLKGSLNPYSMSAKGLLFF